METSIDTLIIAERFRGPRNFGNGGYTAGLISASIPGAVEVILHKPVPLETELRLKRTADSNILFRREEKIATARSANLDLDVPEAPMLVEAASASSNYVDRKDHYLPECFVCGPDRLPQDGLRIFAGPHISGKYAATLWTPSAEFAGEGEYVAPEIVWAALDCPSYFGLLKPGLMALLGQQTLEIFRVPRVAETHVITAWPTGIEGRKHNSGAALYDADGRLLACSRATWIELSNQDRGNDLKRHMS